MLRKYYQATTLLTCKYLGSSCFVDILIKTIHMSILSGRYFHINNYSIHPIIHVCMHKEDTNANEKWCPVKMYKCHFIY